MSYIEQPLSTISVFKRGISLGWSCIVPLLLLYVVTALPGLFAPLSGLGVGPHPELSALLLKLGLDLFNIFLMVWASGVSMVMLYNVATGERRSFMQSLLSVLKRTGALLALWLVTSLLIGIGLLLLVVPGIYIAVMLSMVLFPLILERRGPIDSINTSFALVKGNWWHTAGILGLTMLAGVVVYIAITAAFVSLLIGVVSLGQPVPQESGLAMLGMMITIPVVLSVFQAMLTVLANGVIVITYLNLHARNQEPGELAAELA